MIKRITLTNEHIILIKLIKFNEDEKFNRLFIDKIDPYVLDGRLEDLAMALGYHDSVIVGTENDADGAAFPDDIENHLLDVHHYVVNNIKDIETILHQFACEGIKPGTYKCIDSEEIWSKES